MKLIAYTVQVSTYPPYKGNTLERFEKRLECGQVGLIPNDQEMNKVTL